MNVIPRLALAIMVLIVALVLVMAAGRAIDNVTQQMCGDPAGQGSSVCTQP